MSKPMRPLTLLVLAVALLPLCSTRISSTSYKLPRISTDDSVVPSSSSSRPSWHEVLSGSNAQGLFEEALTDIFSNVDQSKTLGEMHGMLRWLKQAKQQVEERVPELQNYVVQEMASTAIGLMTTRFNELASLQGLQLISNSLSQISSKYGYPMTRRLIVGAILKLRVDSKATFSAPLQELVDRILLQLFRLHRQSAAYKGAIQFFHISKSGGTSLCMCAEVNGCSTENFSQRRNCLIREFSDEPHWASASGHKYVQYSVPESSSKGTPWFVNFGKDRRVDVSCAERAALMKQNNWNFYANEYTVPDGEQGACKQFVNLMIFREPLARLASQISWIQKLYNELYNDTDASLAFKDRTAGFWERLLPAGVNNYYIRSLLGSRFFELPAKGVTRENTQQAMLEVMQQDLLMMLENQEFNDIVLKVGLGWAHPLPQDRVRSSSAIKDLVIMPLDHDKLIKRNTPDVKVHQFAEQLQVLDVLLFKYVQLTDSKLGLNNLSSNSCGYVKA